MQYCCMHGGLHNTWLHGHASLNLCSMLRVTCTMLMWRLWVCWWYKGYKGYVHGKAQGSGLYWNRVDIQLIRACVRWKKPFMGLILVKLHGWGLLSSKNLLQICFSWYPLAIMGKIGNKWGAFFTCVLVLEMLHPPPKTVEENINWVTCPPIPLKVGGSLCGDLGEGKLREFDSCRGEM